MQAFREFKALWDPDNRMNPGKLIDAVRVYDPVENLRHSPPSIDRHPEEGAKPEAALETHFVFANDGGSLTHATERCVGVGACRKTEGGVMCPSYRATGQEQHSTRGRAHLLWEMLEGALRDEGFRSEAVHEALDLCLSCKACKTECPVQVDMAAYKSEFLAQHYKGRLHPLHHYVFGFADKMARLGSLAPALTNAILSGPITSPLIKRIVGIAQARELPRLAPVSYTRSRVVHRQNLWERAEQLVPPEELTKAHLPDAQRREAQLAPPQVARLAPLQVAQLAPLQVVLWADTWNNYYHPQTLAAAESVLTAAGFAVTSPKGHICCGRPLYDFGFLGAARCYLARVLDRMNPQIGAGLPFIFLEPSCASVFKDELDEFFPNDPRANRLREQVWLLADWLAANAPPDFAAGTLAGSQILVHGHCHHKAVFGGAGNEIALLRRAGATVEPIHAGCCGMAGPFGFEAEKFDVSKKIAQEGLLPAIQSAAPETIIVSDGFSCREQISQLGQRQAMHFAEVLERGRKSTALP
jgi:Fe-S oxidoreductase